MRIYTVHIDPLSVADDRGAVFLREGFSWPAAIFSVFWAVYHGLWDWALILLAGGLALSAAVALSGLDRWGAGAVEAGLAALLGASSNDGWPRARAPRGHRLPGILTPAGQRARAAPPSTPPP